MNYYATKKEKRGFWSLPAVKLALRLLAALVLFSLSRWLVYLLNTEFFHHLSLRQAFRLYFVGMRFDGVVLAYANIPVILYYCLPFKFIYNKVIHKLIDAWYVLANAVLILLNMVDAVFFRYVGSRMTSDVVKVFRHPGGPINTIVAEVFTDYWYMLLVMVLFVLLLVVVVKRTRLEQNDRVIKGEFAENGFEGNDVDFVRGTVGLTLDEGDPDSNFGDFFIILDDAAKEDMNGKFCAIGRITEGIEILDEISMLKTAAAIKYQPYVSVRTLKVTVELKGGVYPSAETSERKNKPGYWDE